MEEYEIGDLLQVSISTNFMVVLSTVEKSGYLVFSYLNSGTIFTILGFKSMIPKAYGMGHYKETNFLKLLGSDEIIYAKFSDVCDAVHDKQMELIKCS